MLKKYLKNQKGLTLIELLAVIVILGIIAAIAVPSIGKIMDNSNKDAHVSNAEAIVNATKLYISTGGVTVAEGESKEITLKNLMDAELIDSIKDPSGTTYSDTATKVLVVKPTGGGANTYTVTLAASADKVYISGVEVNALDRDDVKNN